MGHPYASEDYASSLAHIGRAFAVPEWNCHVLGRPVAGGREDAIGCYPIAAVAHDADLRGGLDRLRSHGFVSVTLVLDGVLGPALDAVREAFDLVKPYKTHYLHRGPLTAYKPTRNHRYKINRGYREVTVKPIALRAHLDDWLKIYSELSVRRGFGALHVFPRESVARWADMLGFKAIGGFIGDELVACHIWVLHDAYVMSHLVASSARGYAHRAAYAIQDASVHYFSEAEVINFGGAAGLEDDPMNGLARFKRGFSNAEARSYLCGAILIPDVYDGLVKATGNPVRADFFPAYRAPARAP